MSDVWLLQMYGKGSTQFRPRWTMCIQQLKLAYLRGVVVTSFGDTKQSINFCKRENFTHTHLRHAYKNDRLSLRTHVTIKQNIHDSTQTQTYSVSEHCNAQAHLGIYLDRVESLHLRIATPYRVALCQSEVSSRYYFSKIWFVAIFFPTSFFYLSSHECIFT